MSITLSKNLKQKQSIRLTSSLKKSIDLLQLSRFELIKKIDKEVIENPFLEKIKQALSIIILIILISVLILNPKLT